MATILPIAQFGNKILECKSLPVENIDQEVLDLLNDMVETMSISKGLGLAAPQVSRLLRVIVVKDNIIKKMINPTICDSKGKAIIPEGCLSIPGIQLNINRASSIVIKYINEDGKEKTEKLTSMAARIVQHEIDHIDGKLILDHLSPNDRKLVVESIMDAWRKRIGSGIF